MVLITIILPSGEIYGVSIVSDRHWIGAVVDSETELHHIGVCSGEIGDTRSRCGSAILQTELRQLWYPRSNIARARNAIL